MPTTMSQCPGKRPVGNSVEGDRAGTAPHADQIAELRRINLDPLGFERNTRCMGSGGVDVIGVGFRIRKADAGASEPHHIRDERRRPREIAIDASRENLAVLVMDAGPPALRPARIEADPPIKANPLPQAFFALLVLGQLDVRVGDRAAEGAPFAEGYPYRRLARKRLVGPAGEGRDVGGRRGAGHAGALRGRRRPGGGAGGKEH